MARMRVTLVLLVALAAGGGLAYGTYNYMQNVPVKTVSMPTRPVVVAAADLELGAEVKADDLRVVDWPASSVPNGAFERPNEIVGRGLVMPVIQNEPILPMKLAGKDAGAGLPVVIPQGMRAVSVRVNEVIGVAGYVLPGTRVDVITTQSPTNQQTDTTSKVILSNVQVVTAGTRMEQDQDKNKPVQVTVVTLLVYPEQAERLALASNEGKIQLALRNPLDVSAPETPGVRPAMLLGMQKTAPVHASRPVAGARRTSPGPVTQDAPYVAPMPTGEIL